MLGEKRKIALSINIVAIIFCGAADRSLALPVDMGLASPEYWTVLETGTGAITTSASVSGKKKRKHSASTLSSNAGVIGNVGVAQNGQVSDSGAQLAGDLYLGGSASAQFSGNYSNNSPVTGRVHLSQGASLSPVGSYSFNNVFDDPQPMLGRVGLDAMNASAAAAALSATSTLNQISLNKHQTLTLSPGVYNLTNFQLTHATLTLSGSGSFVFNISSSFALKFGEVMLAGGATESNVLFNYTGTSDINFSGKKTPSVLHGILLALNANVNLTQGLVVGEVISGKNITIGRGSLIQSIFQNVAPSFGGPPPPPISGPSPSVPDKSPTLLLSALAFGFLIAFRSVFRRTIPT